MVVAPPWMQVPKKERATIGLSDVALLVCSVQLLARLELHRVG